MLEKALTKLHTFVVQHGGVILPSTTPKGGHHPIGIDAFFNQNPHCRSVFKSGIKKILDEHPGSNLVYDKCGNNSPGDHRIVAIEYRAGASSSVGTKPSKSKNLKYGCIGCRQPIGKWSEALAHMRTCCPQLCADKNGLQQRCCYSHQLCELSLREFSPEAQGAIDNLVEMGYPKENVESAMIAAFMNRRAGANLTFDDSMDRAVQYLEEGIPDMANDNSPEEESEEEGEGEGSVGGSSAAEPVLHAFQGRVTYLGRGTHTRPEEVNAIVEDEIYIPADLLPAGTMIGARLQGRLTPAHANATYKWRAVEVCSAEPATLAHPRAELAALARHTMSVLSGSKTPGAPSRANPLTADASLSIEGLRALNRAYRGRVLPTTKAEIKAAVATWYRSKPPCLVQWLQRQAQVRQLGATDEKVIKNVVKILKQQWQQMNVLSGSAKQKFSWNSKKIDDLLAAYSEPLAQPGEASATVAFSSTHAAAASSPTHATSPALAPPHEVAQRLVLSSGETVDVVHTREQLDELLRADAALRGEEEAVVAVDCEGVPEELYLIQVATATHVLVLDCVKLGVRESCEALRPLLTSDRTLKLLHDLHNDAAALARLGGVEELSGCLDTQLAMELLAGKLHMGFNDMLKQLGQEQHPSKLAMKAKMERAGEAAGSIFARRPLPRDVIEYAAWDVSILLSAHARLVELLGDHLQSVSQASDTRARHAAASGGRRRVCVDVNSQYALASRELMEACRPDAMMPAAPLVVSNDVEPLLSLLPKDISGGLDEIAPQLSDIVLDKGRRPQAWCSGQRMLLGPEDRQVMAEDIDGIVRQIGGFGSDNRAGLEAQLHRISAIRNRADDIIGLTMRVGRHVGGNAAMIADLLFNDDGSILFLGEPGSGKTTIVREATRLLAEWSNVLIVDTSNEIAGDGDVPHPCVGLARRMQVRSLDEQGHVMIEGVQNHTPEVMVIDEIGRTSEVEAARTCKQRGVRMIASAHGDLRKLLKNRQLRGLVGGVESVVLGDAQAKEEAKKRGAHPNASIDKVKAQRAGPPIFDVIIELRRGELHEWRVVTPCAKAVDCILEGSHYLSQRRTRDPTTGEFFLELERA